MPDLIIKPTNTSGNKVIIQDQAGGAVLTTADSGATLGDSTQDNTTRLGTVTTLIIANGGLETSTTTKIKMKGSFMQSSTHQALTLGY